MHYTLMRLAAICGLLGVLVTTVDAADPPTAKLALSFKPKQVDVEYDIPKAGEYDKCKVTVVRKGKASGWVVLGPGGETLRRFMDTDGDNIVDHWGYYYRGLEVYRDIDSNADNKIDQFRWMNRAGSRWGIDSNADGIVDSWKIISAEEASREAVRALTSGNSKILQPLLFNEADAKELGIPKSISKKLLAEVADAPAKLAKNQSAAKGIGKKSRWLQFINSIPATVPAEQIGAPRDLFIYENAMATVETGSQTALIQIGEMVRVGDTWKLAGIPQLMGKDSVQVGGILMNPATADVADAQMESEDDPAARKLIEQLQELDKNSPALTASRSKMSKYYAGRADLLTKLRKTSKSDELRDQWTRQLTDGLAAGAQTGVYPDAQARLKALEAELEKSSNEAPMLAYVVYRRMLAGYNVEIRDADNEERSKIQEKWLAELEGYVDKHALSDDAPEAILQIAIAEEFNGNVKKAATWYAKLIKDYPESPSLPRAKGAVKRIEIEGKPLELSGISLQGKSIKTADYRGKVLAVMYWATWCKPCTEDLPQIRELYKKHHGNGFEIVGVNVDADATGIPAYLKQHKVTWPQIHEPGGLVDSPPARDFGIITAPTVFLVDREGKVVKRNASVEDLKTLLPDLLAGKTPQVGADEKTSKTK